MPNSVDLIIKILGDTSHANAAFSGLGANISKVLGLGSAGAVVPPIVKVADDYQVAMAKIQMALNSADFAPGTQKYVDAHSTIERLSTTMATSFTDVAASMAQAAKITDQYGAKLPVDKVNEFVDANLRLKASSQDSMDAISSGQSMAMLDKMFSSTDYKGTASMVAALSTQHPQDEATLWAAAIGIGQVGAPLGVTLPQALGVGNYLSDVGGGGMQGGASIGRMLLRMDTSADQVLDPESKYSDIKKNRTAQERLDDLQNELKVAEAKHAEMYGQHGLKSQYQKHPSEVMAEDDRLAKLRREIADQTQNIAHENDPNRSRPRGVMNISEMAKTAGQTADAFAELFKANPIDALLDYTEGLHNLPATERGAAETKAGITNVRDQKTIDLLSDQPASVRRMILMAEQEGADPTAIDLISNIGLGTTAAKQKDVGSMATNTQVNLVGEPMRQGLDLVLDQMLKLGKAAQDDATSLVDFGGGMGTVLTVLAPFLPGAVGKVFGYKGGPANDVTGPGTMPNGSPAAPLLSAGGGAIELVLGAAGATIAGGLAVPIIADMKAEFDAYNNARQVAGQAPVQVNIGNVHVNSGQTAEDAYSAMKAEFINAWNAAMKGTPVAGAMGGNYSTSNLSPR